MPYHSFEYGIVFSSANGQKGGHLTAICGRFTLTTDECVRRYRLLVDFPPLHAAADCIAGLVNVEGKRTVRAA